jgi:hypothetical protein
MEVSGLLQTLTASTPPHPFPKGKNHRYPLKRRLGVVETQSDHFEKEKILTTMPGIEEKTPHSSSAQCVYYAGCALK